MSKLRVLTAGFIPAEFELKPGQNSIGRVADNAIQLSDPSVSSRHGEISWQDGAALFRDLNSTNGSFLDGQPVKESPLKPGQTLKLGNVELIFEATTAVAKPAPIRLSVSKISQATAGVPIAPPPLPGAVPPPLAPAVNPCKNHPAAPATLVCQQCHLLFCDACITPRKSGNKVWYDCPVCRGKCAPLAERLAAQRQSEAKEAESFFKALPGAFTYPIGKGGATLLILGTLLYLVLDFVRHFSWTITVLAGGYLFAYMQKILSSSALGEECLPGWPEFSEWWDDIVHPFLLMVFTFLVSFGPAVGYLIWAGGGEGEKDWIILFTLLAFGFFYFPMALLAVGISDNFISLNPFVVVPAIAKMPLEYFVACVAFFGAVALRHGSEMLMNLLIPIPIVPTLITGFLALYFLAVEMRILGLMYFKNKLKLGWYR